MKRLTFEDLNGRFQDYVSSVTCTCTTISELVGGQPASPDGVRAFVKHHLKIEDPLEAEKAVKRILEEEVGERDNTIPGGELDKKLAYQVNVIRRTPIGPYLGSHMLQACCKQAASRLKIFASLKGTKGDLSEGGRCLANGISALDPSRLDFVYLIGPDGTPATTEWGQYQGSVQTPQGAKSIQHHSEIVAPGTRFSFTLQFVNGNKLKDDDVADFLALMMICGLGSCRSLGCGRFRIDEAEIDVRDLPVRKKLKAADKTEEETEAIEWPKVAITG